MNKPDSTQQQQLRNEIDEFLWNNVSIPEHCRDGLFNYIVHRVPPANFLRAVLENDLKGSYEKADSYNQTAVGAYVAFLYNHAPAPCWGSKDRVKEWLDPKNR